jgi:polyisoprenoid-binding protein YceI
VSRKILGYMVVVILAILACRPAMAQSIRLQIDSNNSTARLFLASSKQANVGINVGVARIHGVVSWNSSYPAQSVFEFTAYPADQSEPGVRPGDKEPGQFVPKTTNYAVIDFKSKRVVPVDQGTFRVTGDLTVTQVQRFASWDPSEAYSGPVYGPAVVSSTTEEATFVFSRAKVAGTPVEEGGPDKWEAYSVIAGEDFPELLNAVAATAWPVFVAEEKWVMPSTVGEDFSGPVCTGKTVDRLPRTDIHCEMPSTVGEDFAGDVCVGTPLQLVANNQTGKGKNQIAANEVKMQLAVQLTQEEPVHGGISKK